jgi:hypothetical protein
MTRFGPGRNAQIPGIPAADLREHERQRLGSVSGTISGSDDEDEPASKRAKPEGLLGTAPGVMPGMPGMMSGMIPPPGMPPGLPMGHMMSMGPMGPQFMHPGMQMMPPHMAMMQGQGGPAKPLFPSAIPTSSPGASIVGADFKPISSGDCPTLASSELKDLLQQRRSVRPLRQTLRAVATAPRSTR